MQDKRKKKAADALGFWSELTQKANNVRDEHKADVYVYSGPLRIGADTECIDQLISKPPQNPNAFLILCTYGGDPAIAYRISRAFLRKYSLFTVAVDGYCLSAGTLIAVSGHEVVMSDHGMLGPLDTQIPKSDEWFTNVSGLTGIAALDSIRREAYKALQSTIADMKTNLPDDITLKMVMDASVRLTTGLFSPIYEQIDPMKMGESQRALDIAREYGKRLLLKSDNLKNGVKSLNRLLVSYPSHSFVIDREEAEEIFEAVREPSDREIELFEFLRASVREPIRNQYLFSLISDGQATDNTEQLENNTKPNDSERIEDGRRRNGQTNGGVAARKGKGAG